MSEYFLAIGEKLLKPQKAEKTAPIAHGNPKKKLGWGVRPIKI